MRFDNQTIDFFITMKIKRENIKQILNITMKLRKNYYGIYVLLVRTSHIFLWL